MVRQKFNTYFSWKLRYSEPLEKVVKREKRDFCFNQMSSGYFDRVLRGMKGMKVEHDSFG